MCGIFGLLTPTPTGDPSVARGDAERRATLALRAMHHRGPDDHGLATERGAALQATFAFARLAILDLSPSGHQPMQTPDGRFTLVFNGEVYNFRALRAELAAEGVAIRSTGDTEVVLQSLAHWGKRALERFVGMFALALFDRDTDTLLLARDRLGKKPLYWTHDGEARGPASRLAFASEVRTLLAAQVVEPRLDPHALAGYLAHGSTQDPATLICNVVQLSPGTWLEARAISSGSSGSCGFGLSVTHGTYWRLPDPLARPLAPDWREALRALVAEAVSLRLSADVPLGIFLSGGIDSAALVALAAKTHRDQLQAFTLTFDEKAWDEGERAARTAATFGVRHLRAHLSADDACAAVEPALGQQDQPSHDGLNTWFVSRAARQAGLVVALAGTGGDEVFGGYPYYDRVARWVAIGRAGRILPAALRAHLLADMDPRVPTRLRKAIGLVLTGGDPAALHTLVREHYTPAQARRLMPLGDASRDALINQALGGNQAEEGETDTDVARRDLPSWVARRELHTYLRNTQLRDIDQMSMAHSLEVRAPLLDHRLVELLLAVPWSAKAPRAGLKKPLLVDAAGLDGRQFLGTKIGFVLPWEAWLRGPLRALGDATLRDPEQSALGGALSPSAVERTWDQFLGHRPRRVDLGGAVNASRILTLISLIRWCTKHHVALT